MHFMRRIASIIVLAAVAVWSAAGQGQIHTKKFRLSDFSVKTTKVVLGGMPMIDEAIREEVASRWRLSPYEFCSVEEYEKIKESSLYYFLVSSKGKFRKESEPGIVMLSVVKGGKEEASDPSKEAMEVVSVPVAPSESPSGREFCFIPALIDIIQNYIEKAMLSDKVAMSGIAAVSTPLSKSGQKTAFIFEGDVAASVSDEVKAKLCSERMVFADEDTAERAFSDESEALVSYVVAPSSPQKGSYFYKMLFGTVNHELYYFERSAFKDMSKLGFSAGELRKIAGRR